MDKIRYTVLISHPSDVDEKTLDFIYQCFDMWNEQNQALPFEFYPFEWDKDVATLSEVANGQDVIDSVAEAYCDAVLAVFNKRVGSPVNDSISGTVHELEECIENDKPAGMIIDSQEVDSREQKLIDYINDFKGLYKEYDSKEKLSREIGLFLDQRARNYSSKLDESTLLFKKHMRFDNPNRVQGITTNYVYNPYFCSSGASLTWCSDSQKVKYGSFENAMGVSISCEGCYILDAFEEDCCACCRTCGLEYGEIYIQSLYGKHYGVVNRQHPHLDFHAPAGTHVMLLLKPDSGKTMHCKYLGLTSRHCLAFDGGTRDILKYNFALEKIN